MEADVTSISNFLAHLASKGISYRTVNAYRSAISAGPLPVASKPVGEHPLISKAIQDIYFLAPPKPRYSSLWDVSVVLRFLQT